MPNRVKSLAFICAVAGTPGLVVCGFHFCRDGHMAHPPYAAWHYFLDALWPIVFSLGAVAGVLSSTWIGALLAVPLLWGIAFRYMPMVGPYFGFLLAIPLGLLLLMVTGAGVWLQRHRTEIDSPPNKPLQLAAKGVRR